MTSYTYDPIHILNTSNTSSISGGGSFAVGGGASIGKNLYVGGNLSISGTTTAFSDNIIVINQNPETSADTGILLQRYSTDITDNNNYAGLIYSESNDEFIFGYAESDPSRTSITFNNLIPIKTNKLTSVSTDNTSGLNSGGSLTVLGGGTINKSLYVGDGVTTSNLYVTGNIYKNGNVFSGQSQWSNNGLNIYYTEGNVGIGTSVANYTLDVTGTLHVSTGITSANANITTLSGTNSTFTNTTTSTIRLTDGIASNISTGTLVASTGITSANANITNFNVTNITIGNIQDLTISGNLTVQGSTTTIVAETVTLDDNLLVLNSLPTASVDGGLLIKRYVSGTSGTINYAGMFYKESTDEFAFATTNSEPGKNSVVINNYLPIRANNIILESTENSTSITNGGALTISGGASITKDLYVGQGITAASAQITTLTGTNSTFTNISTGTLIASTGITSTNALLTSAIGTNAKFTNITSGILYTNDILVTSVTGGFFSAMNTIATSTTSGYTTLNGWNGNIMEPIAMILQEYGGNVGIGNTAPAYKLDVNGTIYASGDIIALSDVRKKTDIATIDNALNKINNLRGVYFKTSMNEKRNVGVIAQEIEEVIPEVVLTDNNGYKGVAYGNITGVLIQGIRELYDIIVLKNTEIDNLKLQMQDVLKRLNNANI